MHLSFRVGMHLPFCADLYLPFDMVMKLSRQQTSTTNPEYGALSSLATKAL
jgi:hypothetical protein